MPTGNWGSIDLGGTVGTLHGPADLRVATWRGAGEARGTIVLVPGRAEFMEIYAETVRDLLARGYAVVAFDFRGQGGSHRRTPGGGHVDRFEDYVADLAAVVRHADEIEMPRPFHVLAHSMGGLVALVGAPAIARQVERMVLAAPLLEVARLPAPAGVLALVSEIGSTFGFSTRLVGRLETAPRPFEGNRLTGDPVRYATIGRLVEENPDLVTGPPTVGWLAAALRAMRRLRAATGRPLAIPSLFVASGADAIVSTPAIDRFARAAPGGGLVIVPGARHQVLFEQDRLRNLFFAAFDAYLSNASPRLGERRPTRAANALAFTVGSEGDPAGPAGRAAPDTAPVAMDVAPASSALDVDAPPSTTPLPGPEDGDGVVLVSSGPAEEPAQETPPAATTSADAAPPPALAPSGNGETENEPAALQNRPRGRRLRERLGRRRSHVTAPASAEGGGTAGADPAAIADETTPVTAPEAGGANEPPEEEPDLDAILERLKQTAGGADGGAEPAAVPADGDATVADAAGTTAQTGPAAGAAGADRPTGRRLSTPQSPVRRTALTRPKAPPRPVKRPRGGGRGPSRRH